MPIKFPPQRAFDVLVIGRVGMDLFAHPQGSSTDEANFFQADMGGSAGNTAVALARHNLNVALWSALSQDPVGAFARRMLENYGVDRRYCFDAPAGTRTTLAMVENRLENFQSVIYRNNAADFHIRREQISREILMDCRCLIVSGTALAQFPSREAIFRTLELAREAGCPSLLDLDHRPYTWNSLTEEQQIYTRAARLCDAVVGNNEEFAIVSGSPKTAEDSARMLAEKYCRFCIYKMGEHGSITFTKETSWRTGIFAVNACKPIGAGDAFMGTLVATLLKGDDLRSAVIRGSAAAALVVSKFGCAAAMPTNKELDIFLHKNQLQDTT